MPQSTTRPGLLATTTGDGLPMHTWRLLVLSPCTSTIGSHVAPPSVLRRETMSFQSTSEQLSLRPSANASSPLFGSATSDGMRYSL